MPRAFGSVYTAQMGTGETVVVKVLATDSKQAENEFHTQVVWEENEIAYQICNITEILSRGRVCATPHCVRAPKGDKATRLESSTFAFGQQIWFALEFHIYFCGGCNYY
ncbi:2-oxoglutarate (2OG) and Fe(II)-dependent oxygenase superfamily protein [Artemisia annua]|uniref:2-oxoglutarate (2OG) and Fe(II)-dependent oxygenase superfamily protein n=1 Tax=Artemisia annua TaxID=35608 RepID=A0A2U1LHJ8_ARTAN|nr:2-oxoglutarate (2OG) and Fe(II)-dependent oxygenase superfamily protein [Artemisia annua]